MKRTIICAALIAGMAASLTMTGCDLDTILDVAEFVDEHKTEKAPKDWYTETIKYYSDGFASEWATERDDLPAGEEMKDKKNKFGYLLRDLDGDGTVEVLIGFIDSEAETRFTDMYIWHTDFGAMRNMHCGDGYYMYLCDDNVIREDSWYGSQTKTQFMKYNGENNSLTVIEEEHKPQKIELTPF